MSQVRKTTFIIFALMFTTGLLSGCGIKGDLYAPEPTVDAVSSTASPTNTNPVDMTAHADHTTVTEQ